MARVLLVHDDLAEAARLRRVLRDAGHAPLHAASAGDAGALALEADAVVVDAACDGGEALDWARRRAADPASPPALALGTDAEAAAPLAVLPAPAEAAALAAALDALLARAPPAVDPGPRPAAPPGVPESGPAAPAAQRPALARTAEAALRALFGARAPRVPAAEARARLDALAQAARTADYFEVLGLPRTCGAEDARLAADALLASLDRDLADEASDPAVATQLADVRRVVTDAREVLADDALRQAYRTGLEGA